jgi:hypothetical protein
MPGIRHLYVSSGTGYAMRPNICLFLSALLVSRGLSVQMAGVIRGTVVDEEGRPLKGAKVHVEDRRFILHTALRFYETDADGRFQIGHLPWGSYSILAGKEDDGYPDTKFAFYGNLKVPKVLLTPSSAIQNVTIHLEPKAGIVDVNSVVSAATWESIKAASVTLRRDENTNFFITASPTMTRLLVPSGVKISIEIRAVGYEDWYYPGYADASRSVPVTLGPGEVLMLDIKLQPKAQ